MVLLIAEGSHYSFHVVEVSRNAAMRRLRRAFNHHLRQFHAPHVTAEEALTINVIDPCDLGVVYRDYEPLVPPVRITVPENEPKVR